MFDDMMQRREWQIGVPLGIDRDGSGVVAVVEEVEAAVVPEAADEVEAVVEAKPTTVCYF